jgi:hypothetical protein
MSDVVKIEDGLDEFRKDAELISESYQAGMKALLDKFIPIKEDDARRSNQQEG